jgi:hypothetical protein
VLSPNERLELPSDYKLNLKICTARPAIRPLDLPARHYSQGGFMTIEHHYAYATTAELLAMQDRKLDACSRTQLEAELGRRDLAPDSLQDRRAEPMGKQTGFFWWETCGQTGLLFGSLLIIGQFYRAPAVMVAVLVFNVLICWGILRYNKWVFLFATVISFNPIFWIVNGIYLKNRWHHPQCNGGKSETRRKSAEIRNSFTWRSRF